MKEYGTKVLTTKMELDHATVGKVPDPKCDNVAFLKQDGKAVVVAACSEYACYTVKGNMLRVLNVESPQEKLLIKGHETDINDTKFSVNGEYLCSVSSDLVAIWRIEAGSTLTYKSVLKLPFGADIIECHPLIDGTFAIGDKKRSEVAVISVEAISVCELATTFMELPMRAPCPVGVSTTMPVDIAFSPDGLSMYVGAENRVWKYSISDGTLGSVRATGETISFDDDSLLFGVKTFFTPLGLAVVTCHCVGWSKHDQDVSIRVHVDSQTVQELALKIPLSVDIRYGICEI